MYLKNYLENLYFILIITRIILCLFHIYINYIMPGYFPLSIPPSPPSINIISEISFTIISLSSTDKLFMEFRFCSKRFLPDKSSINVVERRSCWEKVCAWRLLLWIIFSPSGTSRNYISLDNESCHYMLVPQVKEVSQHMSSW